MPASRAKDGHLRWSRIATLILFSWRHKCVSSRPTGSEGTKRDEVSLYIMFNVRTTYILYVDGCDFLEL